MNRWTIAVLVPAVLTASCVGGSSSESNGLQQADIDQLSSSIASALAGANATQSSGLASGTTTPLDALVAGSAARPTALTTTVNVNQAVACPADGHVTTTGTIYASCPTPPATGACTVGGGVSINFGDRTNNLNDCTFSNGLVVDGTVHVGISGSGDGTAVTVTETLTGSLSLDRKGPTGGLVPIDIDGLSSCWIFLTAKVPERTITGTVCGQVVNQTF